MILLVILGVFLLILIASGLSEMEFLPGHPFFLSDDEQSLPVAQLDFKSWNLVGIWNIIGQIILWVIFPISFIYFIVSPEARKIVLRRAVTLALTFYALFILLRQCKRIDTKELFSSGDLAEATSDAGSSLEAKFSPQTEDLLQWITNIVFVALLTILIWRVLQWWNNRPKTLAQIGIEAGEALDDLHSGADLRDTILHCYAEMSRILWRRKGIRRHQAMTAREFENELDQYGLPQEHVQILTRLFEKARYGSSSLGDIDQHEAETCLQAIVLATKDT